VARIFEAVEMLVRYPSAGHARCQPFATQRAFQRVPVNLQMGLEDGLVRSVGFAVSALFCYNCGCHILSYDYL
jgi:hypothetical protein